jgi:hypothetical protein
LRQSAPVSLGVMAVDAARFTLIGRGAVERAGILSS